jgi:hypothetical protein
MKTYTYNKQKVVTLSHIRKHLGSYPHGAFNKYSKLLNLNKDFFVVPKAEATKIIRGYNSDNAILLNRQGCFKLLHEMQKNKASKITLPNMLCYLDKTFGPEEPPKKETVIINETISPINLFDADKTLADLSTDNPLIQLIIDKAAEKVADRIMNRISA